MSVIPSLLPSRWFLVFIFFCLDPDTCLFYFHYQIGGPNHILNTVENKLSVHLFTLHCIPFLPVILLILLFESLQNEAKTTSCNKRSKAAEIEYARTDEGGR